jgi:hypothetical protein
LAQELDGCDTYISQHYGQTARTAASPFGDTGYDTSDMSRVFLNRGVGGGMIGAVDSSDPFNLPIHLAQTGEVASSFNGFTDTAHSNGQWIIFLVHSITPTTATWYNPVAITDVTSAMSHGKSLADAWNDTLMNIGAYWRAQKLFATLQPTTSGSTTTWTWTLPANFPPGKYLRVKVTGGTLTQNGTALVWSDHGYYEVALDPGTLTLSP